MKYRLLLAIVGMAAALSGCATKNTGPTPGDQPVAIETIKDPPINSHTHFAAGQLAESRGDYDNAVTQYKGALKVDKNHVESLYRLACLYAQTKRYSDSVQIWRQYVTATNGSAFGCSNLAYAEELAGNPVGAEADYKRGIAADPDNEPCRINYGLMLVRHERLAEATVQLQRVLTPAQVRYNIATVYELTNRKEQAKLEYKEALQLDPNFKDAQEKLATLGDMGE